MKLLVTGGRGPCVVDTWEVLDILHAKRPITLLIHGAAPGVDSTADGWARLNGIPTWSFEADWNTRFRSWGGTIRNQHMLTTSKPDAVLAFPGNTGTHDMIARTKKAGVDLIYATRILTEHEAAGSRKDTAARGRRNLSRW